jgi:hypothetical protein
MSLRRLQSAVNAPAILIQPKARIKQSCLPEQHNSSQQGTADRNAAP